MTRSAYPLLLKNIIPLQVDLRRFKKQARGKNEETRTTSQPEAGPLPISHEWDALPLPPASEPRPPRHGAAGTWPHSPCWALRAQGRDFITEVSRWQLLRVQCQYGLGQIQ